MKTTIHAVMILCVFLLPLSASAQNKPDSYTFPCHQGPHGLQGCAINKLSDSYPYPHALQIVGNHKISHTFTGEPFIWEWTFWKNGEQVAYEAGPLHFSMQCILADVKTGKELDRYDCFAEPLAGDAPDWVKTLESIGRPKS